MAFIGNTPTTQAFTPAVDYFSGNGSTTAFTLSRPVASVAQVQVVIDNVAQNPSSAYTISGSTITFTSAPLSGTNNIYVYYTSPITQVIAPGQGTAGVNALDVYGGAGTSAMNLPSGTTAQRPGSPVAGAIRYNSTLGYTEIYESGAWQAILGAGITASVEYLVVAGGGGGGGWNGGGGGAGGYRTASGYAVSSGTSYTVTVGAGGAGGNTGGSVGTNGSNSVFDTITSTGGGGGGGHTSSPGPGTGSSGGSGGGGADRTGNSGGAGTSGQGNAGGTGYDNGDNTDGAGGGGGAGAAGTNGANLLGGAGGVGLNWLSLGTYYAGGGGGGAGQNTTSAGAGGNGGGGAGSKGDSTAATAGTANTGGGGGGGANQASTPSVGASGGSGIVIIRYSINFLPASATTGSPTVTTSGAYRYYTFTSSGTITL